MRITNLAIVIGLGIAGSFSALVLPACGSSTTSEGGLNSSGGGQSSSSGSGSGSGGSMDATSGDDGGSGSSSGSTSSSGSGSSSGSTSSSGSGSSSGGSSSGCTGTAPKLYPSPPGTIYCPYEVNDAGKDCVKGQECCIGGPMDGGTFFDQVCATWSSGATGCAKVNGIPMQCNQVSDCTANGDTSAKACCIQGVTSVDTSCGYPKPHGGKAVVCESNATCANGELQMCLQDADCPTGKTCTAAKWLILDVGVCM